MAQRLRQCSCPNDVRLPAAMVLAERASCQGCRHRGSSARADIRRLRGAVVSDSCHLEGRGPASNHEGGLLQLAGRTHPPAFRIPFPWTRSPAQPPLLAWSVLGGGHDAAGAKAYILLKAILQAAEDDELIQLNPCRLKGAGHAAKNRESIALTPHELAPSCSRRFRDNG